MGEKKRIKDQLYPSDFDWSKKGRIAVVMPPERIRFELYPDVAPLAVQNFLSLCTGNKGTGGESIFGKPFKDDKAGLKAKFEARGVLAMGNSGKNSNTSQFFVTLGNGKNVQNLTGKHVAFGKMISGDEVLGLIEKCIDPEGGEVPKYDVVIADCGVEPDTLT